MLRIAGLDHVVLRVSDLDRSLKFYCDVLGCTLERKVDSIGLHQLRAGEHMIDLVPRHDNEQSVTYRNLDHFCLQLHEFDEAAIVEHLSKHQVTAGDVHMRYGAKGRGPSMYIDDPDGNVIELKGIDKA